jgi:hypothetical protein
VGKIHIYKYISNSHNMQIIRQLAGSSPTPCEWDPHESGQSKKRRRDAYLVEIASGRWWIAVTARPLSAPSGHSASPSPATASSHDREVGIWVGQWAAREPCSSGLLLSIAETDHVSIYAWLDWHKESLRQPTGRLKASATSQSIIGH